MTMTEAEAFITARFPIRFPAKDKQPIVKAWNKTSTTNSHSFDDQNKVYGIQTGARNNLTVLDIDNHGKLVKGVQGIPGVSWFKENFGDELRNTFCVETPSGGLHVYYQYHPLPVRGGVRVIKEFPALEIDIRNDNGLALSNPKWISDQIMGPTSPGYKILNLLEPAQIPDSLVVLLKKNRVSNEVIKDKNSPEVNSLAEQVITKLLPKLSLSLFKENNTLDVQAKKAVMWKVEGKKLTPDTKSCLICKDRTHSVPCHSCVYANESDLVKHCHSAGTEVMKGAEAKRLLEYLNRTVFDINIKDESTTAVQILQEEIWDDGGVQKLRREKRTGRVFKRFERECKTIPYAYIFWKDCDDYLNDLLFEHPKFTSQANNLNSLRTLLSEFKHKNFPWLEVNEEVLGFSNGMLDIRTMSFTHLQDCDDTTFQCRTYFDQEYPVDETFSISSTPALDRLLDFQFSTECKDMLLMSLGRTFFQTNSLERWRYMIYLYGPTGCGKSQIIELMQFLHGGKEYIGTFGEGFQKDFGPSSLIGKRIILVEELPDSIKDVFPQDTFQKCVDGSFVHSTAKGKDMTTEDFTTPLLFAGNWHFNYLDRGQVARRILTFTFENYVSDDMKDLDLQLKLHLELGWIIRRSLELYHSYISLHKSQTIWTFAPKECIAAKEEGLSFSNSFFRFLKDRSKVVIEEGHNEYLKDVKAAYQRCMDKKLANKLDRSIIEQAGFKLKKENICKSCRQSVNLENCCIERSRSNRTTSPEMVVNMKLI